jgi:transcriptional regulator with XRE-family HTH domain
MKQIVRLKEWRERRGYTCRALGERAGISYVTVARIESGDMSPTVETLVKLARALAIDVRAFFPAVKRRR